jgi:hypothetical protein
MVYEMLTCKPAFDMLVQGSDSVRFLSQCMLHHEMHCRLFLDPLPVYIAS